MIVDASAIVARLTDEVDGQELATRMARSARRTTSAIAIFESVAGVARNLNYSVDEARDIVAQFLATAGITE